MKAKSLAQDVWHLIPTKSAPIKNSITHIDWDPLPVDFFKLNMIDQKRIDPL